MSKIKRLAGDTVLYGLGSMIPRMLNFLLLPLHTKTVFNPDEYGTITKLFAIVGFVNIVYMFGMETSFFRFASKPEADQKKVFNVAQTTVIGVSLFLSIIFILFSNPLSIALGIAGHPQYVVWLTLVMFIDALVAIPFARLRLERKPLVFSIGKIINVLILIGLNYYFLVLNKQHYDPAIGVGYVFLATLIANGFYVIFLFRSLIKWRPAFDGSLFKSMIIYAYPIMLTGLAGMTNETFSRITLEWWLPRNFYPGQSNEFALGVFGACYKYAVLMSLAVQAFRFAAEPFFFSNAADKNSPQLFASINHYFTITCCVLLLGVGINMDIIKYFSGAAYWSGLSVIPVLLLGYLFLGIYYNLTVWFKLTDKTYYGTIIAVGGAFLTIILNYVLIPVAGYMGSSIATLLCYFFMAASCYLIGQKFFPIPYKVFAGLLYIIGTTLIVYLVNAIVIDNQVIATIFHVVVIIIYLLIIYLMERKDLRQHVG